MDNDRLPAVIDAELLPDTTGSVEHTLTPEAAALLDAADAANTKLAYSRQWGAFHSWCQDHGVTALPATSKTLANYVGHLATTPSARTGRTPAPSSIEQAIAVIRSAHKHAGHKGHPDTTEALKALKAYRKQLANTGQRKRKAPPITLAKVRLLVESCDPGTLAGLRDRAILVLGFAMMARRSELAGLHLEDVVEDDSGDLTILVRSSKTDQAGEGVEVIVPRGVHDGTDPVRVVRAYRQALAARGITTGRLLRAINQWDQVSHDSMSGGAINEMVQRRAAVALPGDGLAYTAHGFRAGGATEAYRNKAPISSIRMQGRWAENSPQVLEYIRAVDAREENPMRGIGL
jgi:integrase